MEYVCYLEIEKSFIGFSNTAKSTLGISDRPARRRHRCPLQKKVPERQGFKIGLPRLINRVSQAERNLGK